MNGIYADGFSVKVLRLLKMDRIDSNFIGAIGHLNSYGNRKEVLGFNCRISESYNEAFNFPNT